MRMLLGFASIAVLAIPAAPAAAENSVGAGSVVVHRGGGNHGGHDGAGRGDRFPDFVGGSPRGRFGFGGVSEYRYAGEWALYNNRSWNSDSYNDWWHDQPMRSLPRWLTNGTCARMWYSADTLRC